MLTLKSKTDGDDQCSTKGKRRRSLYRDGFAPMAYKDAGVKKLIVLAMAPCKETHENVEAMLKLLNITFLEFAYSADIKMILILMGKQGASCTHACPFCEGSKPWIQDAELTTLGSIWKNYEDFMSEDGGGGNPKKAASYNNVTKKPLITGDDQQLIMGETFFFPELHCLIGEGGKLPHSKFHLVPPRHSWQDYEGP